MERVFGVTVSDGSSGLANTAFSHLLARVLSPQDLRYLPVTCVQPGQKFAANLPLSSV